MRRSSLSRASKERNGRGSVLEGYVRGWGYVRTPVILFRFPTGRSTDRSNALLAEVAEPTAKSFTFSCIFYFFKNGRHCHLLHFLFVCKSSSWCSCVIYDRPKIEDNLRPKALLFCPICVSMAFKPFVFDLFAF